MKLIRSRKHPGIRISEGRSEPGIALVRVGEALAAELQAGDRIVSVDGQPVADMLDFHYHSAFSPSPELRVRGADGNERTVAVDGELLDGESLEFEPLVFKTCGNDCVFCFIHQMPRGLREDLYFMDEDYRLGFLYGNYVTMALVKEHELRRIIDQHLSPVYLSVHSTDMALRNRLLGLKKSRDIHGIIQRLLDGGITLHTQIVLLPGWNDGAALERTLEDLAAYYPSVESVGVVPVGLTDHRADLPALEGFDDAGHTRLVEHVEKLQAHYQGRLDSRFVYLADECYLAAGRDLPQMDDYEEFFLFDNGIGMSRDFVDRVEQEAATWRAPERPLRAAVLSGGLGERLFRDYLAETLKALPGLELSVHGLENRLFGAKITVSGLLPGQELLAAASALPRDLDVLCLPPNTLNAQELFLDDLSLDEFRRKAGIEVLVPESGLLTALAEFAAGRA